MRKCLRKQPHKMLQLTMSAYPLNPKSIVRHMEALYRPGLTALSEQQKEACQELWFQEYNKLDQIQQMVDRSPGRDKWQAPYLMYRPGHPFSKPEYLERPFLTAREMGYLLQRLEHRLEVLFELIFQ